MISVKFQVHNEITKNNIAGNSWIYHCDHAFIYFLIGITYYDSANTYNKPTNYHILLLHGGGYCKEIYTDLVLGMRKEGIVYPITAIDFVNHGIF